MIKVLQRVSEVFENVAPVKFFIVTAAIFGLFFLFVTPPLQTPDETVHFLRSYQTSQLNFVVDRVGNKVGGELPKSLGDTIDETTTHPDISFYANKKYDGNKTIKALSIKENSRQKTAYDFSATALYSPVSYLPQAVGIGFARLIRQSPVVMMYMGRLANLAVWILLISLAVHFMPRKKWLVVLVGLLPMTLSQAASLSSDVMAVGLIALFFAYTLHLVEAKQTLTNRQLAWLLVMAVLLALSKQISFVFLPLVLLLPKAKFSKPRLAIVYKALVILLPCIFLAGWMFLNRGINISASFTNHQLPVQQMKFIIKNPHSYVNVLWNTYFYTWGDGVTRSFIGTFGWSDAPLSELITVVGYIGFAALYFINTERVKQWLSRNQRLIVLVVALAYWGAVNTALYVYYTPPAFKIIYGVQGRYFAPLALLLIPLLYGNWLLAKKSLYQKIAVYLPLFLLVASCITIYVRFYINNV